MPKSGQDLGVDLYELWLAGERLLPAVAEQFAEAGKWFAYTGSQSASFGRPVEYFGGGTGPVWRAFDGLRQTMEAVCRDSQTNLELAGDALKLAAEEYARSDQEAAAQLDWMRSDIGQGEF